MLIDGSPTGGRGRAQYNECEARMGDSTLFSNLSLLDIARFRTYEASAGERKAHICNDFFTEPDIRVLSSQTLSGVLWAVVALIQSGLWERKEGDFLANCAIEVSTGLWRSSMIAPHV